MLHLDMYDYTIKISFSASFLQVFQFGVHNNPLTIHLMDCQNWQEIYSLNVIPLTDCLPSVTLEKTAFRKDNKVENEHSSHKLLLINAHRTGHKN